MIIIEFYIILNLFESLEDLKLLNKLELIKDSDNSNKEVN